MTIDKYMISSEGMKMSGMRTRGRLHSLRTHSNPRKCAKNVLKGAPHAMSAHLAAGTLALAGLLT